MKVPLKITFLAFWLMLMKPPMPTILSAKRLMLTLPVGIDLDERQEREVEPAAVVEVELVGLIDHGVVVLRGAGIRPGQRRAADEALLVGEHDPVEDVLFGGDRRDAGRNAGAEIADRVRHELHGRAARHDLALAEGQRLHRRQRHAQFARVARAVVGRVGLPLLRIDHDIVDQDAGNLHDARRQRAARAMRLTCTMTMPPLRRVACAIDSISPGIASCSMVMLPSSSAVVPRRNATSNRIGLKRSHSCAVDRHQLDQIFLGACALPRRRRGADR